MVNVFRQLVDFVHDTQGWDQYIARPTPVDHSLASVRDFWQFSFLPINLYVKTFRELERSWTGDESLNRKFLCSLGTSMCACLVKVCPCYAMCIHSNIVIESIGIISRTTHKLL